jgi:hypothetical protein
MVTLGNHGGTFTRESVLQKDPKSRQVMRD